MNPTSDEIKKQEIMEQLIWNASINANDIHVRVQGNEAILDGTVSTYAARRASEKEAKGVPGIHKVINNLEVAFPAGISIPEDDILSSQVESRLMWDSQISERNIEVSTSNGVVTLSGSVDTYWEKEHAEEIASTLTGVISVINQLKVVLSKSMEDIKIEENIKMAFERNTLIDERTVQVDVANGVARISGIVPFYAMKREAYDIASYSEGVTDVVDEITIGMPG